MTDKVTYIVRDKDGDTVGFSVKKQNVVVFTKAADVHAAIKVALPEINGRFLPWTIHKVTESVEGQYDRRDPTIAFTGTTAPPATKVQ